jgi:hypothetical protein
MTVSIDLLEGRALRASLRVRLTHLASRALVLGLLTAAGGGLVVHVGSAEGPAPGGVRAMPPVSADDPSRRAGVPVTTAGLVADAHRAARESGATILELRIRSVRAAQAEVNLQILTSGSDPVAIERLLVRLVAIGIPDARIETIAPAPGGSRVGMLGTVLLSTDARPVVPSEPGVDVTVRIAASITASGVELLRIDTREGSRDSALRLRAAGALPNLIDLIDRLESEHTSPGRVRDLRIDGSGASGEHRLDVAFLLREVLVLGQSPEEEG